MANAKGAARAAKDSKALRTLARVGYAVLGIVHIVIGGIAVSIAVGAGGGEADQGGAMEQIQKSPAGVLLLWVIAVGLLALAVWQIVEAFLERDPDTKKKWGYRVKYVGTAAAYFAIAGTAFVYAIGGQSDSSQSSQSLSAQLLAAPAGVFLLVLVGLVVTAVGIAFVVRGATQAFTKKLMIPSGAKGRGIVTFGVVGYIAKGVAVGVAGVLFVVAALTHDAEAAGGMDAAIHTLAALPFGAFILWIVGLGLIIYGIFCFARARYAKM
ncbi:hypothetical protein FHX49_000833 [Microbacterium endophyticum]|uniref:DUF1206 domain-containing protein n=1 Tax=Microbacterium endophyticum TaxID=1526412 RepID=A0A7W4V1S8_9MICO|nr:DUF1206 domain-containing protein [Microbacterium endophyticum]MBB2975267.1 hypothetical protein [Microbacterium endophyticum]NIK35714.1 hypothetical protein [Microbacterium endophyticum]